MAVNATFEAAGVELGFTFEFCLPYPPQAASRSVNARTVMKALTFKARCARRPMKKNPNNPKLTNGKPKLRAFWVADVAVIVTCVLIGVWLTFSVAGTKAHVIPGEGAHLKVTGPTNPPLGTTVSVKTDDCPVATATLDTSETTVKSPPIVTVTGVEILPWKSGPEYEAVTE